MARYRSFSIRDTPMHGDDVGAFQEALRRQIDRLGLEDFGVTKPTVDKTFGHQTLELAREVGKELGAPSNQLEGPVRPWLQILIRAQWRIYARSPSTLARSRRRMKERKARRRAQVNGLAIFEGVTIAGWLLPYLHHARAHGWRGTLTSGYRTPEYSEGLCRDMCGAPSCPGRCAGRSSNHSGKDKPAGAIDVTDSSNFGRIMAGAPFSPKIFNALAPRDVVHFSASGR